MLAFWLVSSGYSQDGNLLAFDALYDAEQDVDASKTDVIDLIMCLYTEVKILVRNFFISGSGSVQDCVWAL